MKVLFIHPNFPAQFRHVATALAMDPGNEIVFATGNPRPEWNIPGVRKAVFSKPEQNENTSYLTRDLSKFTSMGEAVSGLLYNLKSRENFTPDVIIAHSGWGTTYFIKDIYPNVPFIGYFEWYYRSRGSNLDFDKSAPLTLKATFSARLKNAPILDDLVDCKYGYSPTKWQKKQFPPEFHKKIAVMHDGIDTEYFIPNENEKFVIPELDLSGVEKIVTYAARGMEPYRGFPQFIESLPYVLAHDKKCHVVIAGADRVCYSAPREDGMTYKEFMLEKVKLDMSRVHFVGGLPYGQYKSLLQASTVHVYLTYPFVLSWSLLEAMSCGCMIVASNTAPVKEVITDGVNGILVDFFSPEEIAKKIVAALTFPSFSKELRAKARKKIVDNYALKDLLPRHIKFIEQAVNRDKSESSGPFG